MMVLDNKQPWNLLESLSQPSKRLGQPLQETALKSLMELLLSFLREDPLPKRMDYQFLPDSLTIKLLDAHLM